MDDRVATGGGDGADLLALTKMTVDRAPDPILWIRPDGSIFYVNDAACDVFGYGRDDFFRRRITELDPNLPEAELPERWARLADLKTRTFESSIRAAGGSLIPVEVVASHLEWEGEEFDVCVVRDIRERREAQRRLKESEERFREMAEMLPEAVFEMDLEMKVTYANRRALDLFGYGPADLEAGLNGLAGLVPDDRPRAVEALAMRRAGRAPGIMEYTGLKKDGSTFPMLFHAAPILRGGALRGLRVVLVDLTEKRQVEEEIQASGGRIRSLIDASPWGYLFYRMEEDGRLVLTGANPAADRLLGVKTSALVGQSIEEAFPGLAETEVPDRYRDAARDGTPWKTEQIDYDDGRVRGAFQVVAFQTASGEMACMFQDVTERRQAVEALRESEARFRNVIEQSNDAIYILFQGRFDLVNRKFCELTGVTPEAASDPSFSFWSLIAPESIPLIQERQARRDRGEDVPGRYDFVIRANDGRKVKVEASVTEIDYRSGKAVLGVLRDITEESKLEDQLRQAQKMESIGRLSGGVAHDLNNLLSPILGYGEMLLEDFGKGDQRRESVEEIVEAAHRARDLVRQLLAFSRKQTLEVRPVDLNTLVTNFQKLLRRTIREDIRVDLALAPDARTIQADLGQLEQVIMNLAVNAQEAMAEGGRLTIETGVVELDQSFAATHPGVKPGEYVLLAVSDTGAGMDAGTAERVFEPFFTTKEMGTGLGLATVYGIVKQHGGSIWVYSEPGVGSTFKCYFPVWGGEWIQEADSVETEGGERGGTETILVVEDEPAVRSLAETVLRRQGYQVLSAPNGRAAVSLLETHGDGVDMVLTDVVLPGMNGRAVVEEVMKRHPGVRALFMSGYTDEVITRHGVLEEGIAFLQKPFTVRQLTTRVRDVLDEEG